MGAGKGFFTNYPKHVFLILGNEFCERFSFYGMKAILVLFLKRALGFQADAATSIYHGFNMACYFMPLIGAMIADGFLGKYKTIFIISIVYAIGNIVMAVGSIPFDGVNFIQAIPFIGLTLIAIGTGGIKPCVSAFGADQFEEDQVRQKNTFFSMFYMAINLGSLMSMIITPIIRSSVTCFGQECYALAFGVPAALMLVAVIFFIAGSRWYKIEPPGNNVIGKLFKCVGIALKGKCSCSGNETREHWLDYADSHYDKRFIEDVKGVMRVLFMFLPLPIFWALFDQQGSRWILQAGQMNGDFGGFVLEPDLVQVANPLLVVAMVPILESLVFPCLDKCRVPNSPLQRLGVGMFLAGTAFVITALLQIAIDKTLPSEIPGDMARFKIINAVPCDISVNATGLNNMDNFYSYSVNYVDTAPDVSVVPKTFDALAGNYTFTADFSNCKDGTLYMYSGVFDLEKKGSYNLVAYLDSTGNTAVGKLAMSNQPLVKKTGDGKSKIQFFNTWEPGYESISVDGVKEGVINATYLETTSAVTVSNGKPNVNVAGKSYQIISKAGVASTFVLYYTSVNATSDMKTGRQFVDLTANTVNILYQIPQYFVMSLGEVFFSVTGLSFAYSQAPPSMKAVLQAAWLLTNAVGNLIVMIITAVGKLPNQMAEFFLFAGLMYVTVIVFAIMSITYKYVDTHREEEEEETKNPAPEKQGVDNPTVTTTDELPPKYETVTAADDTTTTAL